MMPRCPLCNRDFQPNDRVVEVRRVVAVNTDGVVSTDRMHPTHAAYEHARNEPRCAF